MSRRSGRSRLSPLDENGTRVSDTEHSADQDEADEVTRCICGNDELTTIDAGLSSLLQHEYHIKIDTGLFIQCDKCLVWQHGYCVGLFFDSDVPDKYWCEECKPDLHQFVYDGAGRLKRTLYVSVNELRLRLVDYETGVGSDGEQSDSKSDSRADGKPTRLRSRRSPNNTPGANGSDSGSAPPVSRQERKDRRHGDDQYDAQLQKAIRESARASSAGASDKKRLGDSETGGDGKRLHLDELEQEVDESNIEEESESTASSRREVRTRPKPRPKPKLRAPASKGRTSTPKAEVNSGPTKDELLSQLSRPRFVNEKSTIYELRKRTGAILEWLGRTQMEMEEERDVKATQFSEANINIAGPVALFDENLKMMENLTEKILLWEQKYGKYAP